jgi:hypothetical protein
MTAKFLRVLCVLCGLVFQGFALDREAFTFTDYNLDVRVEPEQQRLAVRGKITLRNDSNSPQKSLSLQISSSLDWRSLQLGDKPVQFVSQTYTSDVDHTGALSEAIVTLAEPVPPKGTVELEIGYEGTIPLDTTRLTRIGVPEKVAQHSDWDQIGKSFTAVRGIGYVVWYPVAMESASLSAENSLFETLGRWKTRHADAKMSVVFATTAETPVLFSGTKDLMTIVTNDTARYSAFNMVRFGINVPTFVIANYGKLDVKGISSVEFLPGGEDAARAYADAMTKLDALVPVGRGSGRLQVLQLSDPYAASFTTEGMLLTPLDVPVTPEAHLTLVYSVARQSVLSPRAWIQEGLAHYARVSYIEQQQGRQVALDYLQAHGTMLVEAEKEATKNGSAAGSVVRSETAQSLVNASDDIYLQTKAMYVWWMLRDMVSEPTLSIALLNYRASEDKEPAYLQRLIEKQSHRDLEWFFDDWVYRDRGLPDFRVESVYPRLTVNGGYVVTITVENLGNAGAEVPLTLRMEGGEVIRRLEVHAKSKATIRIEAASTPQEIVVNDGSVPESDMSNNTYKIDVVTPQQ